MPTKLLCRLGPIVAGAALLLGACASNDTCTGASAKCAQATGTAGGSAGSGTTSGGAGSGTTSGTAASGTRAYPTVFIGPGCGSNGMNGIQIQTASGNNAIVIGLDPSTNVDPEGRQCFDSQSNPNPEIPYVEQTVAKVEAAFCVDKSRLFI